MLIKMFAHHFLLLLLWYVHVLRWLWKFLVFILKTSLPIPVLVACQALLLRIYLALTGLVQKFSTMRSYVPVGDHRSISPLVRKVLHSKASRIAQWRIYYWLFLFLFCFYFFFKNWAPFVCQTHPFLGMSEKSPTCMEFACKGWASINTKTIQWDNHWSWDAKWSGDGENGWSRM